MSGPFTVAASLRVAGLAEANHRLHSPLSLGGKQKRNNLSKDDKINPNRPHLFCSLFKFLDDDFAFMNNLTGASFAEPPNGILHIWRNILNNSKRVWLVDCIKRELHLGNITWKNTTSIQHYCNEARQHTKYEFVACHFKRRTNKCNCETVKHGTASHTKLLVNTNSEQVIATEI